MEKSKCTFGEIMDLIKYISFLHNALLRKGMIFGKKGTDAFQELPSLFRGLIAEQDALLWLEGLEGEE